MSEKQTARQVIDRLPETASYEDIIERLCFMREVEAGREDAEAGRVISHEALDRRVQEWRRK